MSENQFDKGYSLALRCYSGRINDKYNSVTQDRGDVYCPPYYPMPASCGERKSTVRLLCRGNDIWKEKPLRSKDPVFIQSFEFTGTKIAEVRAWIQAQPPAVP
ncbi:hypothetical protein DEU56DRAFT_903219 [Suillus clintonianus]|uniref:uncharacterized protein n=1 Tax=Suillus clintonianus TaxID=1904413 RepID=UPI001B87EEAF|nr:uncharacterized protein DEU56DRAFT_903219 [Suillus clintonianus]KAG2127471.1 hypothetical protein DEU56DRAFT_903219 [Suillus clintonianus]